MAVVQTVPACRFAYSACTVGVGAVLTSHRDAAGDPLAESWAPASLPIIGGRSGLPPVGPVDWPSGGDPVLHFDRAETVITGRQLVTTPGAEEYETIVRKTVTNLNVLNRVIASIGVEITFHYTRRPTPAPAPPRQRDRVDVSISLFQPFVISTPCVPLTPPLPSPINLKIQIPQSAGGDFKEFLRTGGPNSIDTLRPTPAHHKHEHGGNGPGGHGHGLIYTALVEPQAGFQYQEPCEFGRRDVPGLGRIYVGEWHAEPYRQSFTFLRVVLENAQDCLNPRGTFSGQVVIDDENGTTNP